MKFLSEYFYGGIDWHDSYSICNTMFYNGKVCNNQDDYILAIADSFKDLYDFFTISREEFINILQDVHNNVKDKVEIPMYVKEEVDGKQKMVMDMDEINGVKYYCNRLIVSVKDNDYLTIEHEVYYGQASYYFHFSEVEIADDDLAYMVCENFHVPTKGVPCVERMYTDLFDNLNDAQEYQKKLNDTINKNNNLPCNVVTSESTLNIVSRSEILLGDFYKLNMQAIELMKQKNVNRNDKSFQIFVNSHLEKLAEL